MSRGSIKCTKEKFERGDDGGALAALARLNRHRTNVMRWWTFSVVLLALAAAFVPQIRNAVLPALEIAEKTPGRRLATRAGLLAAGPVIAFLTRGLS